MTVEGHARPAATVGETLEAVLDQVRRLFDASGCAFLMIEGEPRRIEPAAAWFSSPAVAEAMGPVLRRRFDVERPGLTEAAVERGAPLVIRDVDAWPGAPALRQRLADRLDPQAAEVAWQWYRRSCLMAVPVRTVAGRFLGVMAIAVDSAGHVGEEDIRSMEALAGLAAVAVERSRLLDREAARAREEVLLKEAAQEMPASLALDDVHHAIVGHARRVTGAAFVVLETLEPTGDAIRLVAQAGAPADSPGVVAPLEGARARALAQGRSVVEGGAVHVPLALGPRRFAILTAGPEAGAAVEPDQVRRLEALAPLAAGAIANALDFARERRVARALARGFVPFAAPAVGGFELGVVYDPAELAGGGGDFFGVWPLSDGGTAVLVGDVSGKGLEVSATSAMTRFFVEARTWDCHDPSRVLSQVNALLCARGQQALGFATAFLGIVADGRLRYANAGHVPPVVRRSDGELEELPASGMPLGVDCDAGWEDAETPIGPGELLFAATDGLFEARRDGEVLGEERVRTMLRSEDGGLPAQELVERAHRLAIEWAGRVRDDIVVVGVRVR